MAFCTSRHPAFPDVACLASSPHPEHYGFLPGQQPDSWPNPDYVEPPPKTKSSGAKQTEVLGALADRIRRPVGTDVLDIGHNHPDTSVKMAARKIGKTGTQRQLIYSLALGSVEGVTDDEIEQRLGFLHQSASAARNSLMNDGWLYDTGIRRRTRSGEEAIAWIAHPGG